MAKQETHHDVEDDHEPDESGVVLPERNVMTTLVGGSLFSTPTLDPTQTLGSDPAAGTPAAGATDPSAGIASATQDVSSVAHTAQQSDSGASAQNIDSAGSVSSATTPPPDPSA